MNTTYIKNLQTPIAVVGLGKSGLSAHKVLLAGGHAPSDIILFDEKSAEAQVKNWDELSLVQAKTWVVSPGVPLQSLHIAEARAK
ncbi:MAG: UDP-N-acetylmuramoyl-L-alanine--D-glutamate ligase, partial [Bdellovibrionaceae bacterium]|nr:UDP-N-acetylmuramoyl-L-alanine--D-glutamate ligase [Pseudobdellovibrionaceae bacterium]